MNQNFCLGSWNNKTTSGFTFLKRTYSLTYSQPPASVNCIVISLERAICIPYAYEEKSATFVSSPERVVMRLASTQPI